MDNFLVAKSKFKPKEVKDFFGFIDAHLKSEKMELLNRGYVYPALFRRQKNIHEHEFVKKLKAIISEEFQFKNLKISLHSDFHIETLGGWHTDEGKEAGGYLPNDVKKSSKIFKCGVYLCENKSKLQNTMISFKVDGKVVQPKTEVGDIVFFPIEITHKGYSGNLIVRSIYFFTIRLDKIFNTNFSNFFTKLRLKNTRDLRRAFFFTFGEDSEVLNYFENKNFQREKNQIN